MTSVVRFALLFALLSAAHAVRAGDSIQEPLLLAGQHELHIDIASIQPAAMQKHQSEEATITEKFKEAPVQQHTNEPRRRSPLTRNQRAHDDVNAAINKVFKHCQQLDKVFQIQGIWESLRDDNYGSRGRRMKRDQFQTAVEKLYKMNAARNTEFKEHPDMSFFQLASRILKIITPLIFLQRCLNHNTGKQYFEHAHACDTELMLMNPEKKSLRQILNPQTMEHETFTRTGLPAELVKKIFQFVGGDVGKLALTKQVVQEALNVVKEQKSWHPYYGCSKYILLTHGIMHTHDDGSFNFVSCQQWYANALVLAPCLKLFHCVGCLIFALKKKSQRKFSGVREMRILAKIRVGNLDFVGDVASFEHCFC